MEKFIMKYNGAVEGKSGRVYYFNKGQEIEAQAGEFHEGVAEMVIQEVQKKTRKKREVKQ